MPDPKLERPLTKPSVNGIAALPGSVLSITSSHVELLARLGVAGGTLTTREVMEVCAAVVDHIETTRQSAKTP